MTRAREISNVLGRNIESTTFTATAGQTAFSITHAAGRIQVYMNGLLLDPTVDWTSDGSTVTLTEGAVAGDELEVVKFDNLAVADAIPRTGHTGTIDFSDATFVPPAGHVVQVVQYHTSTTWTVNATEAKLFDYAITTKLDNSNILAVLVIGRGSQNSDTDIALAMGYKSGSPSSSTGDYTSLHTSNYTRQLVSNLGSFWTQDTSDPNGGNWNGHYNISAQPFNRLHSPDVVAGTTLNYSVWASSDGIMRIGNSYNTGNNGYDTTLTLMEIAQ